MSRYSFKPPSGRKRLTKRAAAAVGGGIAVLATTGAMVASAAPPVFPDNIVVFPDRDFVSAEGFTEFVGKEVTTEVVRDGQVVGSAVSIVEEGDHAFEINHPGGACWGAGAGSELQVTPDIVPGDVVRVKYQGDVLADTTVQDAMVTADSVLSADGTTLTITGRIADGVNPAQVEQRVVNPDLTDTDVSRRDVRAVPGGPTAADKGGYTSDLVIDEANNTFTATYEFFTPETAQIAASGGGERFMSWQVEDAQANRQGLTIAEYGEVGGPGMGGCPAGPLQVGPPEAGEMSAVRSNDKTSVQVNWAPVTAAPGSSPVVGYSVEVIDEATNGEQTITGKRTGADATRTTISGLDPAKNYTVEVRSRTQDNKLSPAFPVDVPGNGDTPPENADTQAPTIEPSHTGTTEAPGRTDKVTLTASEQNVDIYYTLDGSDPLNVDLPADGAKLYSATTGIAITDSAAPVTVKWVAFDAAGNVSEVGEGVYQAPDVVAPAAPTELTATSGMESLALRWTMADTTVTDYEVQLYNAAGETVGGVLQTQAKFLTVPNLTAGTEYYYTVKAKGPGGWSEPSTKAGPFKPAARTDIVTVTTARYRAGDEFRVGGDSTALVNPTAPGVTGTITVHRVNTDGSIGTAIQGAVAGLTAAVAPDTGSDYSIRIRNPGFTNPGRIIVKSSFGGQSAPFTVTR